MKPTPTQAPITALHSLFRKGLVFLSFTMALLMPSVVKASHIVGGDITYRCLGNNKYEITLNVYRDCFYGDPAAWFDNPAKVGIYRKSNNTLQQQVNMFFSGVNDTLNNFITDTCLFVPPAVCVHATQYKKIVTIPYDPAGYEILYQRCCRNLTVQNIIDPFFTGATYCVTLSGPAMQQCNSTPDFGAVAPIYLCVNQPLVYDHSAVDPDGDSLVYRLNTPLTGGTFNVPEPIPPAIMPPPVNVTWNQPTYNEANMLGASIPLAIDPHTGVLTAFPTIQGQFVVGIAVEEYRNGVLLSTVRRDFQYNIGECGEVISSFFAPDVQCDDLSVELQNNSTFADEFIWYFDWGGDLSLKSTQASPTFTYPDTGWYTIALIAEPNSVCVDTSFHQIYLQANSLFTDFGFTVFDCVDTTVLECFDLSFDTVSPVVSWNWEVTYTGPVTVTSNLKNPVFIIPRDVSGTITLTATSLNTCVQTISKPFETGTDDFPLSLIPDAHVICKGDSAVLNPLADSIGPYPYFWEPSSLFADPASPVQTVSPDTSTVYTVFITAVDSNCFASAEIPVTVKGLPQLAFDYDTDCNGSTVNFTNNSQFAEGYFWDFGDPGTLTDTSSLASPAYSYPDTGTYVVTLATGPDAQCKDTITQEITLFGNFLSAGFTYELNDCETDSVTINFTDMSQNNLNNTVGWEWDFGPLGVSNEQNPSLTVYQAGTITVMYTITTADNCQDSLTQEIEVIFPDDQFLVDSTVICLGDTAELNPGGNPDLVYLWSPADGLSDPAAANPLAFPSQTTTYTVTIAVPDFTTCFITREVKITVPEAIELVTSGDVTTCDPATTLTASTGPAATITWNFSPGGPLTGNEITVPVSGSTVYTITAEDAFGCSEQASLTVQGGPVDYEMSADSIVICSDEPFSVFVTNLDPNDVLSYQWASNPAILSGGNTSNPAVSNEPGQTVLYVDMENQYGCVANDSVYLAIIDADIVLDFDYEIIDCDGLTVQFNNLSQFAYDYVWDFGDPTNPGAISFEENPVYTYPYIDTFFVTLDVVHNAECVQLVTKPVILLDPVLIADFRFGFTDCSEGFVTISFNDLSQSFLDDITNWEWTFSTGETSTAQNPVITVTESQTLTATLVITTALGCTDSVSYDIPVELTVIDLVDTLTLCYGDTADLNPNGNSAYQYFWSPPTGLSDPTAVNPQVFVTQTTTYTVGVTNFIGDTCQITKTVTVFVPEPIVLDASGGQVIACNEPISLTVSGNITPLEFTWYNSSLDSIGAGASIVVFPTNTTNYYVEGVDEFGCSAWDTVVVTVPTQIEVAIEGEFVSCQSEVTLTAITNADPVSFQWFANGAPFGGDSPTVIVNPGTTTAYTVIATDTFGCQASADSVVTVPPAIEIEVSDALISCQLPVNLFATANVDLNYVWTVSDTIVSLDSAFTIQPPATVWFYVTGTDALGCTAQDSVLVTVPPPVSVTVEGQMVSCLEPVTLETVPNLVPVSYLWSPGGATTSSITVNPGITTVYTVMVTDTFGCQAMDTALVVVPNEIELTVTEDLISCQTEVELSASGNVPLTFEWSAGGVIISDSSSISVNPVVTTIYTVLATDTLGCQATEDVLVTVPTTIELDVTQDTVACEGPIVISASGNVPLVFEWWAAGMDTVVNSQITVLPDTTGWYYVLVTDDFGCQAADSVFVTNGIIDVQAEGQVIICPVDSLTLEATNNDPFDMLSYVWSAGTGGAILSDNTLPIVTVSTVPGPVEFYLWATNQFGCEFNDTVVVVMSDFNPVVSDTVNACRGIPTPINPGGNPGYTYNWEPVIGGMDPNSPNPVVTLDSSQTFTVTITDFEGVDTCSAVLEVTVLVNPDIQLDAQGDTTLCEYVPVFISATAGVSPVTFTWYDDAGLTNEIGQGSPITVTPEGNMIYYVLAEDALGCLDTAQVSIDAFPIDISTIPQYDLCLNEELVIGVINNAPDQELIYNWGPDQVIVEGGDTPTPTVNPTVPTTFSVIVQNQYGCLDTAYTFVNVIDILTGLFAEADPDTVLFNSGETSQLTTVQDNDYSYFWWPDSSIITSNSIYNPVANPYVTTTYFVEITDEFGCRGLDSVTVTVLSPPCEPPYIFVPTGFSPNGDGENDTLFVRGNSIDVVYFAVYSRWGQLIFETEDLNVGWDGTFKGEALPPDVFGWYLRVKCFNGDEFFDKGNVTLLR